VGWEPPGADRATGEYIVSVSDGRDMFVEVKARGWEQEIVQAEGTRSPRLQQPKYIHAEFRSMAPWMTVREAAKKAYHKMPNMMPTLLVIHDIGGSGMSEHPLEQGWNAGRLLPPYRRISGAYSKGSCEEWRRSTPEVRRCVPEEEHLSPVDVRRRPRRPRTGRRTNNLTVQSRWGHHSNQA
jgi:hypothetical protein